MTLRDLVWVLILSVPHGFWRALTWLGDSGLLLPVALLIAVWLPTSRRTWPTALLWLLLFGLGLRPDPGLEARLPGLGHRQRTLQFHRYQRPHRDLDQRLAGGLLAGMASRCGSSRSRRRRGGLGAVAAAIGVSRLALDAHSASEVVTGYGLGVAVSGSFLGGSIACRIRA